MITLASLRVLPHVANNPSAKLFAEALAIPLAGGLVTYGYEGIQIQVQHTGAALLVSKVRAKRIDGLGPGEVPTRLVQASGAYTRAVGDLMLAWGIAEVQLTIPVEDLTGSYRKIWALMREAEGGTPEAPLAAPAVPVAPEFQAPPPVNLDPLKHGVVPHLPDAAPLNSGDPA